MTVRGQALVDWVARGGHLVVAVGGNWQSVSDSVLGPILPAVPTGQERVTSLEALDSFAGSNNKPITPAGSPAVLVTKLEQVESRGGKVLSATGDVPLVVRGAVRLRPGDARRRSTSTPSRSPTGPTAPCSGSRRSTSAASPARPPARPSGSAAARADLPVGRQRPGHAAPHGPRAVPGRQADPVRLGRLLHLPLHPADRTGRLPVPQEGPQADGADLDHLPDDRADGQPAWPTSRPTSSREASCGSTRSTSSTSTRRPAWRAGRTFVNLFSPQNRDYDVSVVPLPLDRDPPAKNDADGPASRPPAGTEVLLTWFGVPEPGFGGHGQQRPDGVLRRRLHLRAGRARPRSSKGSGSRSGAPSASPPAGSAPRPVLAEADLGPGRAPTGSRAPSPTACGVPLKDAIVAFGKQVYIIGTIAPGRVQAGRARAGPAALRPD